MFMIGTGCRPSNTLRTKLLLSLLLIIATTLYTTGLYHPSFYHHHHPQRIPDDDPPQRAPARVLLVTAWYPPPDSHSSDADYHARFFARNTNDIVLYTAPQYENQLRALRGANLTLIIDTRFASPFDVPPLKGKEDAYRIMAEKDRAEAPVSSLDVYATRHAKPFFLHDAVAKQLERTGRTYEYVFWSDAGSFREEEDVYGEWPSRDRLQEIWEAGEEKDDDVMLVPSLGAPDASMRFWTEAMGPVDSDVSIGTFFGGRPAAVEWFARAYYAYHDQYLGFELFIGKNEALINALLFLFPERFITVWANQPVAGQCGLALRYYYEFWVAGSEEREAMREVWIRKVGWWRWWVDKTGCGMREELGVETVLRSTLGDEWRAPGRSVEIPEKLGYVY